MTRASARKSKQDQHGGFCRKAQQGQGQGPNGHAHHTHTPTTDNQQPTPSFWLLVFEARSRPPGFDPDWRRQRHTPAPTSTITLTLTQTTNEDREIDELEHEHSHREKSKSRCSGLRILEGAGEGGLKGRESIRQGQGERERRRVRLSERGEGGGGAGALDMNMVIAHSPLGLLLVLDQLGLGLSCVRSYVRTGPCQNKRLKSLD